MEFFSVQSLQCFENDPNAIHSISSIHSICAPRTNNHISIAYSTIPVRSPIIYSFIMHRHISDIRYPKCTLCCQIVTYSNASMQYVRSPGSMNARLPCIHKHIKICLQKAYKTQIISSRVADTRPTAILTIRQIIILKRMLFFHRVRCVRILNQYYSITKWVSLEIECIAANAFEFFSHRTRASHTPYCN